MVSYKGKACKKVKKFWHCIVKSKGKFHKKSFRTLIRGKNRIVIGCPKSKYDVKRKRCKVGTQLQKILKPVK